MSSLDLFGNPLSSQSVREPNAKADPSFLLPTSELEQTVEEEAPQPRSFSALTSLVILMVALLATQTFRLQVTEGSANQHLAEGESLRIETIQADRGLITDFSGATLADNTRRLALAINPQKLPAKLSDRQQIYKLLQTKAGIDDKTIQLIETNRLASPEIFPIKTNLSKDESLLYKEWFASVPGVLTQEIPIRHYQNLPSFGQLVGYVGPVTAEDEQNGHTPDQQVGKAGLEKVYDSVLGGTPGREKVEVNAAGEIVGTIAGPENSQPQPGQTLRLSLDSHLQQIVATALQHELDRRTKKFGPLPTLGASAVVMDPATGAIKAMVSLPDFDPNPFAQGISQTAYQALLNNPGNPLLNRAIQGQYPSGSVIKPLIAAAALQAGIINENTQVVTPDAIYVGSFRFPDWKTHGLTNVRKAIAESNDIFFYALGGGWPDKHIQGLGIETLDRDLAQFGLGGPTGIDLPGEASGLLATPQWKQKQVGEPWYIGDTYHASIGQGYTLVTPLQMAVSTSAVANGGTVWQPHLAWSTIDPSTGKETVLPPTALAKNFIGSHNLQVVREGMRQTVESGSAQPLRTLKVTSAGKTGTAEFGTQNQTHAWYTGFAPYENPQIVFSVMIEGGGESFYSSEPVAEEILRGYFNDPVAPGKHLNSEPDLDNAAVLAQFQGEH